MDEKIGPAELAEKNWRQELEGERAIRNKVQASMESLEGMCQQILGLPSGNKGTHIDDGEFRCVHPEEDMVLHHMDFRLERFREQSRSVTLWKSFRGSVITQAFNNLDGGHLGTQIAGCFVEDVPYLVCCVCVATDPLVGFQKAPKGLLLHWSVTDDESSSWHNSIPRGWSTDPGVCEPHGSTAWQTSLAHYNPVVGGQGLTQIPVHSVVVQIPLDGIFLEKKKGGIKFIFKRSDVSDEVWIKSSWHGDFYLNLGPAIQYLSPDCNTDEYSTVLDKEGEEAEEAEEGGDHVDVEEYSSKFIWARTLAEELTAKQARFGGRENLMQYTPSHAWLDHITEWVKVTDYAINAGSSLSQYARELRLLVEITGEAQLSFLMDDCTRLESYIEALDVAEIKQRSFQLEKDRLWEERELAVKEAARVQHDLESRVEGIRKTIALASGRDSEVSEGDLIDLCSSMVLGSTAEGGTSGAGFFRNLLGGSDTPIKHMVASQSIDRVGGACGVVASVASQVYFEGKAADVEAVMSPNGEEEREKPHKSPFDAVLIAIAFGEDFPSKLSHSDLRIHWGLVASKNGKWIPQTDETIAVVHRDEVALEPGSARAFDMINFEAYHMRHHSGKRVLVDPLVRGIVLRMSAEELKLKGVTGIEFVVTGPGHTKGHDLWMKKECGSNFFARIPLI
jgi:hypothetical protein